jgi:uncharacterized membrane protein (UPF0127 family)
MTHLSREASRHDRLTPTLMLVVVILLATWMGTVNGGYFVADWALVTFVLAAVALIVSATGLLRSMEARWSSLALGLFTVYTVWTFASLLWSPNQGDAWLGAGQTLLYLLAFWLATGLISIGASRRWALAASVIGPATVAALTLFTLAPRLQDLFGTDFNNGFIGRLLGTVGYYNGEAAFLLVPLWVAVYLAGSRHVNPILRGLVLAGAALCVAVAILTQSRGAVVAVATSLPVFFLFSGQRLRGLFAVVPIVLALLATFPGLNEVYLALLNQESAIGAIERALPTVWLVAAGAGLYGFLWGLIDRLWRPPKSLVRIVGGAALLGSIGLFIFAAAAAGERTGNPVTWVEQRWEEFVVYDPVASNPFEQDHTRYLAASGSGRYTLWQVAWEDFTSHPFWGVGTQNYEATYYQLRKQDVGYVRQPHNLPLEVLAERGIVGGVLFFGFLATCLGAGLWKRFSHLSSEGKAQVGAMAAAVTYWFVHSSAEWFWQLPAVTLPAIIYLAMLVGPWERLEAAPVRWHLRVVGIGVALLAVATVAPLYVANRYLEHSYATTNSEEALAAAERAQLSNPLSSELSQREAELAMQSGDWDRAQGAYRNAIELNPEHYASYLFLGEFYEQRGDLAAALSSYEKALALNPLRPELNRGVLELSAQAPTPQKVAIRFLSEGSELGRLNLTVANGPPESERNLQGSVTLPPEVGVLYVWSADNGDPLWIKDRTTPLDVAFARELIVETRSIIRPSAEPVQPQQPYRVFITTDHGFFERNSIQPGSQIVVAPSP